MESSKSYMNLSVNDFIKEMTRKYDLQTCEQNAGKRMTYVSPSLVPSSRVLSSEILRHSYGTLLVSDHPGSHLIPAKSKKRTYEETFGPREYDNERYGQGIDDNFFQTNIGHAVIG